MRYEPRRARALAAEAALLVLPRDDAEHRAARLAALLVLLRRRRVARLQQRHRLQHPLVAQLAAPGERVEVVSKVDTRNPTEGVSGLKALGASATPINLILLGSALSNVRRAKKVGNLQAAVREQQSSRRATRLSGRRWARPGESYGQRVFDGWRRTLSVALKLETPLKTKEMEYLSSTFSKSKMPSVMAKSICS